MRSCKEFEPGLSCIKIHIWLAETSLEFVNRNDKINDIVSIDNESANKQRAK